MASCPHSVCLGTAVFLTPEFFYVVHWVFLRCHCLPSAWGVDDTVFNLALGVYVIFIHFLFLGVGFSEIDQA